MTTTFRPITRSIRSEREYDAAIREIERLLEIAPGPGTPDDDRLDLLSVLVEAYESENGYDLPDASPQEVVDFMLDQRGMVRANLAESMGGRSRVSQFFRDERRLSINQIWNLHELLNIPVDLLITKPGTLAQRGPVVRSGPAGRPKEKTAGRK